MNPASAPEWIFVYNADSGWAAALFDSAHNLFSPQTYECNLCALTHGLIGPKSEWSAFLKTLPVTKRFLHRDDFFLSYPEMTSTPLPAIYKTDEGHLQILVAGDTLSRLSSLKELIALLET